MFYFNVTTVLLYSGRVQNSRPIENIFEDKVAFARCHRWNKFWRS